MDEYFCTKCGAILNNQIGFDPNKPWTCTECGTTLFGDGFPEGKRFPGVVWYCDGCGAVLNTQQGFNDEQDEWECTECGYFNSLSEDNIFANNLAHEAYMAVMNVVGPAGRLLKSARAVFSKGKTMLPIGISPEWAAGRHYEAVLKELRDEGFTNLTAAALEDLPFESLEQSGASTEVILSGKKSFKKGSKHLPNSQIVILYHSPMRTGVPLSAESARGMDYNEVAALFQEAGFGCISLTEKKDLFAGLMHKKDSVEAISISGADEFKEGDRYPVDAEVAITHHASR